MLFWLIIVLSIPVWFVPKRFAWVTGGIVAVLLILLGSATKGTSCSGDGCIAYSVIADFFLYPPAFLNGLVGLVRSFLLRPNAQNITDSEKDEGE